MRENLSLLSYWGLIFTLIAVTLFVVVYMYMSNTGKGEDRDMVEYLRRRSVAIYLAAASSTNEDISSKLRTAAEAYPADSGPTKYGDMRRAVA